jgi:hypothetical protein
MEAIHPVYINGIKYGNVASITPEIVNEYYYNVTTRDGVTHQKILYSKTNYKIQFFNLLDGVYYSLREYLKANNGVPIRVGIPTDTNDLSEAWNYADYYITITDEMMKGTLNGRYFKNGLTVLLERAEV